MHVVAKRQSSAPLDSYLGPGERVLWRGKPVRAPFVLRTWPLSLFGALLLMSVLAFETVILSTEAPDWLAIWGVPFAMAGLYMAAGHFLLTWLEWQQTEYLVTESRVLIRHGVFSSSLTTYSLLGLPHTKVEMHGKDVGNIMFKPPEGQGYGPYPGYSNMWPYTPGYMVGMMYIHDPDYVRGIIEGARGR